MSRVEDSKGQKGSVDMMQAVTLCAETTVLGGFVQSKPSNQPSLPVETDIIVMRLGPPLPHGAQN